MAYKTLYITDTSYLSLKNNRLKIVKSELEADISIDDISTVIVDGYSITLSLAVMNHLSESGVTVILCNEKKLPIATILPFEQHSRQSRCMQSQISLSEVFKKKLWQAIVKQKIQNQYQVLLGIDKREEKLLTYKKGVLSGDSNNREAVAAKVYFQSLLEGGFRSRPSYFNSLLDYGYAIVRSSLARSLASYGFYTSLGIHHKSEFNQYNLADDMIEPLRPVVDYYVYHYIKSLEEESRTSFEINKEDKIYLSQVLNQKVFFDNKEYTLSHALDLYIKSFRTACNEKDYTKVTFPEICR